MSKILKLWGSLFLSLTALAILVVLTSTTSAAVTQPKTTGEIRWDRFIQVQTQAAVLQVVDTVFTQCNSVFGPGVFPEKIACHQKLAPVICTITLTAGADLETLRPDEARAFERLVLACVSLSQLPNNDQLEGFSDVDAPTT